MGHLRVGSVASSLTVDQRRARQTTRPVSSFKQVLKGSAQVLLAGAATATRVVGMPTLSAAISRVASDPPAQASQMSGSVTNALGGVSLQDAQQQGIRDDLSLLALQDAIQRRNRQIALVSNVMKARHDTAKSAIGNIRA